MRNMSITLLLFVFFLPVSQVEAREILLIGQDGQIDWEGDASGAAGIETIQPEYRSLIDPSTTEIGTSPTNLINFSNLQFPESIVPRQVQEGQNIAAEVGQRGGRIRAPTVFDLTENQLNNILANLISPDPSGIAFERKGRDVLGTLIELDLGTRIGVNQIRFFPRNTVFDAPTTPFQEDFLKTFELQVNDGEVLTEAGNPIWESFVVRDNNTEPVTVIEVDPPRFLRFIRLRATSGIPFEVEKLQVFGEGFFPTVQYISPIIDMGTAANWGLLRWVQEIVGDASQVEMQVRTRSGIDASPLQYNRKRVGLADAEDISTSVDNLNEPLGRREYLRLPVQGGQSDIWERSSIRDDLENWSPWTPPYNAVEATSEAGTVVLSPGPRRYFQFRVDFLSQELNSTHILKQLSYEFTTPPLADELVGEIFPREVVAATDVAFVYAVRTRMESGDLQGFDAFELVTGNKVSRIERIEILGADGQALLDHTFTVQDEVTEEGEVAITEIGERGFAVRFPLVREHGAVLKIHFINRVLSYSTTFEGRALLLAEDAFQGVNSGDATQLDEADLELRSDSTVLSPAVNSGDLVGSINFNTQIFTPNGDGANDELELEFEILAVVGAAQITVDIHDLTGRRVRRLFDQEGENGVYNRARFAELAWDGTDKDGDVVSPGLYLVRIEVAGDARSSGNARVVALVY